MGFSHFINPHSFQTQKIWAEAAAAQKHHRAMTQCAGAGRGGERRTQSCLLYLRSSKETQFFSSVKAMFQLFRKDLFTLLSMLGVPGMLGNYSTTESQPQP